MSKKANPTIIGAFVIGAITLVVVAVIFLGGGKIFRERQTFVTYFEGSIQGLRVGANVNFRGVRIGQVRKVYVRFDESMLEFDLPVIIELEAGAIRTVAGGSITSSESGERITALIERGLRAQLEMESFVTGQLLIDLDFHPGTTPVFRDPKSAYQEIPTIPSDIQLALENMQEIVAKLKDLPVEEVLKNLTAAINGIEKLVNSPELANTLKGIDQLVNASETQNLSSTLQKTMEKLDSTASEVKTLVQNIDQQVNPVAHDLTQTMDEIQTAVIEIQSTFKKIRADINDETIRHEISTALNEFRNAARSFRVFVEYLEVHPEAFIQGKPSVQ